MITPADLIPVVQLLQVNPYYYRHFADTWWRFKKLLKAHGYAGALAFLGDADEDPAVSQRFSALSDEEFLAKAFEVQHDNARFRWREKLQADSEGVEYYIHDPDVEA